MTTTTVDNRHIDVHPLLLLRTDLRAARGHSQSEAEPAHWATAQDEGIKPSIDNRTGTSRYKFVISDLPGSDIEIFDICQALAYISTGSQKPQHSNAICLSVCLSECTVRLLRRAPAACGAPRLIIEYYSLL